ncbi:hypothetical protein [Vineibacter terrae]|uniref:hypothetical protein n=1 Tax=Vineibacter terrae TaxID=2586908 RepID=UPI002E341930|nr:hypothetical protein [Vineibacter terrae]HEX2887184.1 hypothetical protein [Vineibacter terrae]
MADPFDQQAQAPTAPTPRIAPPHVLDRPGGELVREPSTGRWYRIGPTGEWTPATPPASLTGLYGQGVNDSVAILLGFPVDVVNAGISQIGLGSDRPIGGSRSIAQAQDYISTLYSRARDAITFGRLAPFADDRTSRQPPKSDVEKIAYGTGRGMGSALGTLLPAAWMSTVSNFGPVTQAVAGQVTRGPTNQVAAGIAGGVVTELTGNPWWGLITSIGGGGALNGVRAGIMRALDRTEPPLPGTISPVTPPGPIIGPTWSEAVAKDLPMLPPRINPTRTQQAAGGVILKSLERDRSGVVQAQDDLSRLGPDAMLADVAGRNLRGKVRLIANAPGEGADIAEQALLARRAGEGARIENLLNSIMGQRVQAGQTADDLLARRAADSRPLYEKAFARGTASDDPVANKMADIVRASQGLPPVQYGLASGRIQSFLADPIVKEGLRRGIEIQRLEALAAGRPFNLKGFAISGFDAAGNPVLSGTPNMRLLSAGKRGLDDILEGYRDATTGKLALDQRGRAIDQVRRSLLGELDRLNPDYAAARAAWDAPSSAIAAIAQGRNALSTGVDPHQLAKQYGALGDAEREMFRLGAADWIRRTAGENTRGSPAQRLFGNPKAVLDNQAERLKIIFGERDYARIKQLAESEATFNRTLSTLSGWMVKPLVDEAADVLGQLRAGTRASNSSPSGVIELLDRARQGALRRSAVGPEAAQAEAARLLFAGTPEEKTRATTAVGGRTLAAAAPVDFRAASGFCVAAAPIGQDR